MPRSAPMLPHGPAPVWPSTSDAAEGWAARIEREAAARAGPPTPVSAGNGAQLVALERLLYGRVRTPGLE